MFRGKIKNTIFTVLQKITSYDFNVGCVHAINYSYIGADRVLGNVVDKEGIVFEYF